MTRTNRGLWVLLLLLTLVQSASAYTVETDHPRLFATGAAGKAAIVAKCKSAEDTNYEAMKSTFDASYTPDVYPINEERYPWHMASFAILNAVETDTVYYHEAKAMMTYLWSIDWRGSSDGQSYLRTMAIFYDWFYDELGAQGSLLAEARDSLVVAAQSATSEFAWYTTNPGHTKLSRLRGVTTTGIALGLDGDADDDAIATAALDSSYAAIFGPHQGCIAMIDSFARDGGHYAGDYTYTSPYEFQWALNHWDTGTDVAAFDSTSCVEGFADWHVWNTFCDYGGWGDAYGNGKGGDSDSYAGPKLATRLAINLLGTAYQNAQAMWLEDQFRSQFNTFSSYERHFHIVLHDTLLAGVSPATAAWPIAEKFDVGTVFMRDGWDLTAASEDIWACYRHEQYPFGHAQADAGHLEIIKGQDPLLIAGGYYDSGTSQHHIQYASQAIGQNCITIKQFGESFHQATENTGGQDFNGDGSQHPATLSSYTTKMGSDVEGRGTITDFSVVGDTLVYIRSDLTDAYAATKVDTVRREIMWLEPKDTFLIFDTVKLDSTGFLQKQLFHMIPNPATLTSAARWTQGDGTMKLTSLFGTGDVTITEVGGTGHHFDCNGTNYGTEEQEEDEGDYRLELSPGRSADHRWMLTAIQVTASADTSYSTLALIETGDYIGAAVDTDTLLFHKYGGTYATGGEGGGNGNGGGGIWEENLNYDFAIIEVGNGDTLYAMHDGPPRLLKRSLDDGATWTTVKTFTRVSGGSRSLFVDSKGRVYVGLSGTGKVHRGLVSGDSLAFTDVLTMQCDTGSGSWWNMAQADAGSLFVGNYAGAPDEHCAAIYRSSTGKHWSQVYYTPHQNRHVHVVGVDPWSDDVYASIGDIPLADARIVRSQDYGATWDTVRVGTPLCKPVSLAFTPTRRLWGSDVGGAGTAIDSTNVIEWTADDSAYTQGLRLEGDEDNYVWAMGATGQRTLFAGTVGKRASGNDIRMYASWDSGGSWYTVKEFECAGNWHGVKWISRKADNDGFSYYTVTQADGGGFDSYRFTGAAVWTIGSGGDFATIAAALADWRVGPGDTLELLAGSHVANGDELLEGMTLRGATQDASLYIVKNGARTASAVLSKKSGTYVQDITFRDLGGTFTTANKAMLEADDGADLTVTRCEFMSLQGVTAPGFYALGDGAGATTINLTFNDCRAETCKATGGLGGSSGAFSIEGCDVITIDGLVAVDNYSSEDGGAVKINTNAGQVTIKNSLFLSNRANDEGAALYVKALNTGNVKVWHCTFDANEGGTPTNGQVWFGQLTPTNVLSHCIIANGDSTYAVKNGVAYIDSIRHVDSWNNGEDHIFGDAGAAYTDTIHVDPDYNSIESTLARYYAARAEGCCNAADGSYMGWWHYVHPGGLSGGHRRTSSRRR